MPGAMRLFALRGAHSVQRNERDAILDATAELMREVLERNGLGAEALVSCLFTTTPDLDAEFPALAARQIGLGAVPLLCAREIDVPGALPRIVRVLVHFYAAEGHEVRHVYLGEAQALRRDLAGAQ